MTTPETPQAVVKYNEFDVSRVVFGTPLKNKHGGKYVSLKYRDTDNVEKEMILVLPWLRAPFGVSAYTDKVSGKILSYSLPLTLDPKQEGAEDVQRTLESLYKAMVLEMKNNDEAWVNEELLDGQAEILCKKLLRSSKGKDGTKYPPNFSMKFPLEKDSDYFDVKVYSSFKQPPVEVHKDECDKQISKGSQVRGLVICNGIWITNKNASMVFRASQLQYRQTRTKVPDGLIKSVLVDSDDEDEDENNMETEEMVSNNVEVSSTTPEADTLETDEEEEDNEEEEEEVERDLSPPPKKTATRGRKRKVDTEHQNAPATKH